MRNIEVLDCTLRDGGYVNNWNFTDEKARYIISELQAAGIEYIECGFISNKCSRRDGQTIYKTPKECISKMRITPFGTNFTFMMKVNEYNIEQLMEAKDNENIIIRLSFHKSEIDLAIDYAIKIKSKGYKLFFQPTVINNYSEDELIELSKLCNTIIRPDGFAIVDTLGVLVPDSTRRITSLLNRELNDNIKLILHCHNNMQNAYCNATVFIDFTSNNRDIVIDSTLLGMGRNAGNLPTEVITYYLNNTFMSNYSYENILNLINNVMLKIKEQYGWGYSPYYLINAQNVTHPKYLNFFMEEIKNLNEINLLLSIIPYNKKFEFDLDCAQKLLGSFMVDRNNNIFEYELLKKIAIHKQIIINSKNISYLTEERILVDKVSEDTAEMIIPINDAKLKYKKVTLSFYKNNNISTNLSFNYVDLLQKQRYQKTDDLIVFLIQVFLICGCKNIAIFDDKQKLLPIKYKISKSFENSRVKKHELLLKQYIDFYKKEYNIPIIKGGLYDENSSSGTDEVK